MEVWHRDIAVHFCQGSVETVSVLGEMQILEFKISTMLYAISNYRVYFILCIFVTYFYCIFWNFSKSEFPLLCPARSAGAGLTDRTCLWCRTWWTRPGKNRADIAVVTLRTSSVKSYFRVTLRTSSVKSYFRMTSFPSASTSMTSTSRDSESSSGIVGANQNTNITINREKSESDLPEYILTSSTPFSFCTLRVCCSLWFLTERPSVARARWKDGFLFALILVSFRISIKLKKIQKVTSVIWFWNILLRQKDPWILRKYMHV